jgi:hypothetical protein
MIAIFMLSPVRRLDVPRASGSRNGRDLGGTIDHWHQARALRLIPGRASGEASGAFRFALHGTAVLFVEMADAGSGEDATASTTRSSVEDRIARRFHIRMPEK